MEQLLSFNMKRFRDAFSFIPNSKLTYGILKKCSRCSYQKSNEPILIVSKDRGPRIIIDKQEVFVRSSNCLGQQVCGNCFIQCKENLETMPCRWKKI